MEDEVVEMGGDLLLLDGDLGTVETVRRQRLSWRDIFPATAAVGNCPRADFQRIEIDSASRQNGKSAQRSCATGLTRIVPPDSFGGPPTGRPWPFWKLQTLALEAFEGRFFQFENGSDVAEPYPGYSTFPSLKHLILLNLGDSDSRKAVAIPFAPQYFLNTIALTSRSLAAS